MTISNLDYWQYDIIDTALREKLQRLTQNVSKEYYDKYSKNRFDSIGQIVLTREKINQIKEEHDTLIQKSLEKKKMGRSVIGFGQINVDEKYFKDILKQISLYEKSEEATIDIDVQNLYFKMYGNNIIDYTPLEKLKQWCIKHKIPIELSVVEYIECDGGFYYDSEEKENSESDDED